MKFKKLLVLRPLIYISHTFLVPIEDEIKKDPCVPSNPCGPFSECRDIGNSPACSCLPNYLGKPPNCRPECVSNYECPKNLACINERCKDPCISTCGLNAICTVVNHASNCVCPHGTHTGDPFTACTPIPYSKILIYHSYIGFNI